MNKLLPLLLVCLCCACSNAQTVSTSPSVDSQSPALTPIIMLRQSGESFNRTPSFTLNIFADGTVFYEGGENAKTKGVLKSSISPQEVQQLISTFESAGFWSFLDKYDQEDKKNCPVTLSDAPIAFITLAVNGKSKSVYHNKGCEGTKRLKEIIALEDAVVASTKAKQWLR